MIKLNPHRNSEWPIVRFWYTRKKGQTIEQIIDTDITFFEWAVANFQNITPGQASYYCRRTGHMPPSSVIKDVTPYEHGDNDPEQLYEMLCKPGADYDDVIKKYRGIELSLF